MLSKGFSLSRGSFWLIHVAAVIGTTWALFGTKAWGFTFEVNEHVAYFVHNLNKTNDASR